MDKNKKCVLKCNFNLKIRKVKKFERNKLLAK